jgi:hypothetical protein
LALLLLTLASFRISGEALMRSQEARSVHQVAPAVERWERAAIHGSSSGSKPVWFHIAVAWNTIGQQI